MAAKSLFLSLKVVGLRGGLSPLSAETREWPAIPGAVAVRLHLLQGAAALHWEGGSEGEGVGMGNPSLEVGKSN